MYEHYLHSRDQIGPGIVVRINFTSAAAAPANCALTASARETESAQ